MGGPKKNGHTFDVVNQLISNFNNQATIETVYLKDMNIKQCVGCEYYKDKENYIEVKLPLLAKPFGLLIRKMIPVIMKSKFEDI